MLDKYVCQWLSVAASLTLMQSVTIAFQLSEDDIPRYTQRVNHSEGQTTIGAIIDSFLVNDEYDYVCIPLTNKQWHSRWQEMCIDSMGSQDRQKEHKAELWRSGRSPLQENEVILGRLEESTNVVALASEWICLDAPDEWVRLDSESALEQELSWASYLNIGMVILPPPQNRESLPSYARAVSAALNRLGTSRMELSIRIPIYDPRAQNTVGTDQRSTQELVNLSWETWDLIRSVCDYHPRLSLSEQSTLHTKSLH
jgi:protein arginine N-methyltransferase 5